MIVVVTGGSGSGKSEYAETLALNTGLPLKIYAATMKVWDEEGRKRVARHRQMRAGKGFQTVECFHEPGQMELPKGAKKSAVVLLECMSNLTANEYYRLGREKAVNALLHDLDLLEQSCACLIVVTNEVFSDGVAYEQETFEYMEILGEVNRYLGQTAASVTEVVYGIPIQIK